MKEICQFVQELLSTYTVPKVLISKLQKYSIEYSFAGDRGRNVRRYVNRIVPVVHILKDLRKDTFYVAPNSNSVFKEFTVGIRNISEVSSKNTSVDSIFFFV